MRSSVSSPPHLPGPERPCGGGGHRRKVGHADPHLRRAGRGPILAAVHCGRLSSNNLPPCRSGAAILTVPRSPAPAHRRSAPQRRSRAARARGGVFRRRPKKKPCQQARLELCVSPLASPAGFEQINGILNAPSVISRKNRSTMLSHEALVGVKWIWKRGLRFCHALTFACLWVA